MRLWGHVVKVRINTESFILILSNFTSFSCVSGGGGATTTEIVHSIYTCPTIFTWLSSTVTNIYDREEIALFSMNTLLQLSQMEICAKEIFVNFRVGRHAPISHRPLEESRVLGTAMSEMRFCKEAPCPSNVFSFDILSIS